ncbi:AAA domain-containing protein [Cohnella faecalis]|uniref:AAA domain-containing protein n=1 Tax=Cohnella faecalis TaxID=2315694 RepID=UPI001F27726F|nr:AAA domain-containing protein [Cohnella faecalis]
MAELVYEHFRNYPERSLGVVTFSEAQQQAVETAIRQLRLQNQEYEKFFNEKKEEAFFIKNLENVQGDERDTIIFSIGYAKDPNGIMYMNFGPLSRSGGYRRLNVAITRAKHNVKLVGSIRGNRYQVG